MKAIEKKLRQENARTLGTDVRLTTGMTSDSSQETIDLKLIEKKSEKYFKGHYKKMSAFVKRYEKCPNGEAQYTDDFLRSVEIYFESTCFSTFVKEC